MDKEEMLAEANLRYPKGTVYEHQGINTVQGEFRSFSDMITDGYGGAVWTIDKGWSPVISYPDGFSLQEGYPIF